MTRVLFPILQEMSQFGVVITVNQEFIDWYMQCLADRCKRANAITLIPIDVMAGYDNIADLVDLDNYGEPVILPDGTDMSEHAPFEIDCSYLSVFDDGMTAISGYLDGGGHFETSMFSLEFLLDTLKV